MPTPRGGDAVVEAMVGLAGELRTDDVVAVGAGVPGFVDRSGVLRVAPNLPGVFDLPVRARIADALGLPVRVDNDATCALWGEHVQGACAGVDDAVLVTLGTGIGGGLLLDGRLVRGANGFAGEPGHMVVQHDGIPCVCGRAGCWERYVSGSALGRAGRNLGESGRGRRIVELAGGDPFDVRGEHVAAAAAEGDPEALELFDRLADWFAIGLVNLVHVLDVSTCVIGGGLVETGDLLLGPIRRRFAARLVAPEHRPPVDIVPAALGERAGAIGAALLAREALQPG